MTDSVKLQVSGPVDQVRATLEQALQPEGFRATWENAEDGLIEKGTRTKALLLGVFATHYKYRVLLHQQSDGTVIVDIGLANTGLSGGAAGVAKVRKKLDHVGRVVTGAFQSAGGLVNA
ncbi:hypothetical protein BJF79_04075 [Actinomadura sp. CNU-125]|uniref:hypothetical protein n=1 Tax=Actinomadura sp. CNU-125 TaxID=1904961 RepID=UPI0009696AE0|nr:hypothetical protein [Actinomadura sp. CNU-125]OLT11981.1 hypothetical protein BJF79_04075 [Actinomadura sp. CNU-125]